MGSGVNVVKWMVWSGICEVDIGSEIWKGDVVGL